MAQSAKNILQNKAFPLFCIFFFLAFSLMAHFSLWTKTEIYPVHSSRYLMTDIAYKFLFSLKPLFYFILYLSSAVSDLFSLAPMTGARLLFALNGLGLLALVYFYIKKKAGKYSAVLAVLLLAGSNIFLDRGFRVRSDLLISSLSLLALLASLNIKADKCIWKTCAALSLLGLSLLVSPKAVYWIAFSLCLMAGHLKNKNIPRPLIARMALAFCAFFSFLSFILKDPFFIKSFYQAGSFWLSGFRENLRFIAEHGWIKSLYERSHLAVFAERNLLIIALMAVKLCFSSYSAIISKKRKWDLSDLHFFLLLAVFFLHPQQKLFFLCALSPFFFIAFFTDSQWKTLESQIYSPLFKNLLLAGAFLFAVSYSSYFNYRIWTKKNNRQQKELMARLNSFYGRADPAISIFDPGCLIYSRQTDCKYIFDSAHWRERFEPYIKEKNFDLILGIRPLNLFDLAYYKDPPFQYVNIQNYIFYKAFIMDLAKKEGGGRPAFSAFASEETTRPPDSSLPANKKAKQGGKHPSKPEALSFIKGETALKALFSSLKNEAPAKFRKYSYLFLDSRNQPIKKTKNCSGLAGFALQPGCPYSHSAFAKGWIPAEGEKLAVFYLPLPLGLPEELSLRAFRYDIY